MTVRELIKHLKQVSPDKSVYLSSDEEGNGFGPIFEITYDDYDKVFLYPCDEQYLEDLYENEDEMKQYILYIQEAPKSS